MKATSWRHINKGAWLCSSKTSLIETEIWISHICHTSWNILTLTFSFPQPFKNVKPVLSSQVTGNGWQVKFSQYIADSELDDLLDMFILILHYHSIFLKYSTRFIIYKFRSLEYCNLKELDKNYMWRKDLRNMWFSVASSTVVDSLWTELLVEIVFRFPVVEFFREGAFFLPSTSGGGCRQILIGLIPF